MFAKKNEKKTNQGLPPCATGLTMSGVTLWMQESFLIWYEDLEDQVAWERSRLSMVDHPSKSGQGFRQHLTTDSCAM